MAEIKELRAQQKTLATEAQGMIKLAEGENRGFTAEETEKYDKLIGDFDDLGARADRQADAERRAQAIDQLGDAVGGPTESGAGESDADDSLVVRFFRGDPEVRTLTLLPERRATTTVGTKNSPADGSVKDLVEATLYGQVMTAMTSVGGVLPLATQLTTTGGSEIAIPWVDALAATQTSEATSLGAEQKLDSSKRKLNAFKVGALVSASSESLTDTAFDVEALVAKLTGEAIGEYVGAWLASGTGTNQPTGIYASTTTGPTAVAAIDYDSIVDLMASVPSRVFSAGQFLLSRAAFIAVMKLKDTSGLPLLQPNIALDTPMSILGRPVNLDDFGPAVTTGKKPMLFGDFSSYFVRFAGGVRFERSDHVGFGDDTIKWRGITRVDGKYGRTDLVRALEIS